MVSTVFLAHQITKDHVVYVKWKSAAFFTFVFLYVVCQIPRSYLILQEAVIAEKKRRHAEGEVQYLTEAQLLSIIEQNPESDIRDYEDLQTGTQTGMETHFMF